MPALRLSPALAAWAQLAADLVNTAPRATHPEEELRSAADVAALLARCPEPAPAAAARRVEPMRALRPALREAIEAGTCRVRRRPQPAARTHGDRAGRSVAGAHGGSSR